jgi:2-amino-4-hydroxy-6-hydroxymethyldihydropteridine diphosphokinase
MPESVVAYVGLGSNLNDPGQQVLDAFEALDAVEETRVLARSSLYRSAPMGPNARFDFINAVAKLATGLEPLALLDALQAIETRQGRVRMLHWGPRTLDLDILLFGDLTLDSARLVLPHPGISTRNFVLHPLAEIAPGLVLPGLGPIRTLLQHCGEAGLERLDAVTASGTGRAGG